MGSERCPFALDEKGACVSHAEKLGGQYVWYVLTYGGACSLLLFGFCRAWLFNFRHENWSLTTHPRVSVPFLGALSQLLLLLQTTNLDLLQWETRALNLLGQDLFLPCAFSMFLVYYRHKRLFFVHVLNLRPVGRTVYLALHVLTWLLAATFSALAIVDPTHHAYFSAGLNAYPSFIFCFPSLDLLTWLRRLGLPEHRIKFEVARKRLMVLAAFTSLVILRSLLVGLAMLRVAVADASFKRASGIHWSNVEPKFLRVLFSVYMLSIYGATAGGKKVDYAGLPRWVCVDPLTVGALSLSLGAFLITVGLAIPSKSAFSIVFFQLLIVVVPLTSIVALLAHLYSRSAVNRNDQDAFCSHC